MERLHAMCDLGQFRALLFLCTKSLQGIFDLLVEYFFGILHLFDILLHRRHLLNGASLFFLDV